ncbi:hypothetical protein ANANG_G00267300 [Anguilla anguilla]|uniref:Uncharacterized protein n=1 Tax=Anguilla anguilla TaxID=7936 RepID=A0A9D3LYG0_ANGAN|nr:hypothetical protein ANANG_G00267300 [Anguilla anguilla]
MLSTRRSFTGGREKKLADGFSEPTTSVQNGRRFGGFGLGEATPTPAARSGPRAGDSRRGPALDGGQETFSRNQGNVLHCSVEAANYPTRVPSVSPERSV